MTTHGGLPLIGSDPYHNETSQDERREALINDRDQAQSSQGVTYIARATATMGDELGGRFAHLARGQQQVVGTGPSPYPQLPSGSPWRRDPVPQEPPLNQDVNALPESN
jgi:hypothetical protein